MSIFVFAYLLVVSAASAFLLVRNHFVYRCRMAIINDDDLYWRVFKSLPSYDEMVLNPKHWGRWTKRSWVEFAEAA